MGLFDRLSRVTRANLNEMLEKAENPEMVLEQAIIDMQEDLIQLRQAVARAIATHKHTEQKYNKNHAEADQWHQRAQLALTKGDENLAREALIRKKAAVEAVATLKSQIEQQTTHAETLKKNLIALESKISEAKTKKDMLKSRAAAAKANEQLQKIGRLGTGSAVAAFEHMEEKVLEMEARSQAADESVSYDLEKEFEQLPFESNFNDELEEMKRLLTNSSAPHKPQKVLIMERAIRDTRDAMANATAKQRQLQNQHVQAKTEINNCHKKAVQAALKGEQASAMQALMSEAAQERLADVLKIQLEHQEAVFDILKQNLTALEEVKTIVEKAVETEQDEGKEVSSPPSSNLIVDIELKALREQIDNLKKSST